MYSIKIKSFFDHKRGIDYWDGADRSAMNLERGRFAMADGVTHSYLPNLWAEILCESFVNSDAEADEDWIGYYSNSQLNADCQLWRVRSEYTLKNATEEETFLLQLSKDECHYAGSTLVGIAIEDNFVFYNVLGDSCLFVFDKEKKALSSYSTINEKLGFTTTPDFLFSAGKVVGQWKHGSVPLTPGYILLMTDALSEWFTKIFAENPAWIEKLWTLNTHDEFMELVENARDIFSMEDDDVALLMLRIEEGNGYEVLYCDTMEALSAKQKPVEEVISQVVIENQEENSVSVKDETKLDPDEKKKEQGKNAKCNQERCELAGTISYQSQEEDSQVSVQTVKLEQKPALTEKEKIGAETNKIVIEHVFYSFSCPYCGSRYLSDDSLYCAKCGHSREVPKISKNSNIDMSTDNK